MIPSEFKLLNTFNSWESPYSVIAHIDLDAFYSQVQAVTMNLDPSKPLASRQWHSVIAVNYPARDFKIKRGMSVKECQQLCPDIQLPHVPTFKKGSTSWALEKEPKASTHKVSLDLFRRESRKIFEIFQTHFKRVGKAGIDEAFIDLGPDIYARVLEMYPQINDYLTQSDEREIPLFDTEETKWENTLHKIGAEMVQNVRMEIFRQLQYTCSSGIASNKLLAKLGSAFKKPFNQTLVLPSDVPEFLDKHNFTDLWGWGGMKGQGILEKLGVEDTPSKVAGVGIEQIFIKMGSTDMSEARQCYQCATGTFKSQVKIQTHVQSMSSVKEFSSNPLLTMQDLNDWLIVYCTDLVGRLEDMTLDDPKKRVFRPATVAISYHGGVKRVKVSKQQPCSLPYHKSPLEALSQAVASMIPADKNILPCVSFSVKLSNINGVKPNNFFTAKELPVTDFSGAEHDELFVSEASQFCKKCRKNIPIDQESEHKDWHLAKTIQSQINSSPKKPKIDPMSPRRSAVQKHSKVSTKQQPTLLNFFSKEK